ncbi:MAG: NTP transferase domain-containing protein [Bacteroidetes bacterium]|nr:NTP transferase domain-containing protein [Bacteroidota bacterium]
MKDLYNIGVVILSAGESSRMNSPKAFLKYDLNRRFIDKIIDEYKVFGINNIVVVINKSIITQLKLKDDISICINEHLEYERFYSIKLGLEKIGKCVHCFIQNIDNPFVNQFVLNKLFIHKIKSGCTIPIFQKHGGHPVLLGEEIINKILSTKEMNLNFKDILNEFPGKRVDVDDESILRNINTLEDYNKYFN